MRNSMRTFVGLGIVILAGCATTSPEQQAAQQRALHDNIPVCTDAHQCEGMWAAARNWVTSNCGMKIQTMTDSFIETYNSTDTSSACRVTKDPQPQGGYTFSISVSCGNMFGCVPSALSQVQSFQATVNATGNAFKTDHSIAQQNQASPQNNSAIAPRVVLGVAAANKSELPPAMASALGERELKGVFVLSVTPASVADKVGMKVGDDFYEFDGKAVSSSAEMKAAVAAVAPGSSVSVKVMRNAAPLSLNAQF